jgi:hypothetical protein
VKDAWYVCLKHLGRLPHEVDMPMSTLAEAVVMAEEILESDDMRLEALMKVIAASGGAKLR